MSQFPLSLLPTVSYNYTKLDKRDALEKSMSLMHNTFIRILNSLYLNADAFDTNVTADLDDFLTYISAFTEALSTHHRGEENYLFPRLMGDVPEMAENVSDHAAIHACVDELNALVENVKLGLTRNPKNYYPSQLRGILTTYGSLIIHGHLSREITTLDPERLKSVISEEDLISSSKAQMAWMRQITKVAFSLPVILGSHDISTNQHFPDFPAEIETRVPQICAEYQGDRAWRFCPFNPVTREALKARYRWIL